MDKKELQDMIREELLKEDKGTTMFQQTVLPYLRDKIFKKLNDRELESFAKEALKFFDDYV